VSAIYGRQTDRKTNLFLIQKRNSAGEISEKGKGDGWWGACGLARTGGAAQS